MVNQNCQNNGEFCYELSCCLNLYKTYINKPYSLRFWTLIPMRVERNLFIWETYPFGGFGKFLKYDVDPRFTSNLLQSLCRNTSSPTMLASIIHSLKNWIKPIGPTDSIVKQKFKTHISLVHILNRKSSILNK